MNKINEWSIMAYVKMMNALSKEEGEVNIVATVLLIGVAVLLAIIFRGHIENLLESLFGTIENNAANAIN
ncbi:MAG: flagellin-like protein [Ruminococcus sp.]|nr:flagellin-like protein [Ruminococcus sp.]